MSDREAVQAHVLLSSQGHQTALHRAAMVGNSDIIDGLIKGGCALDLQDKVRERNVSESGSVPIQLKSEVYIHLSQIHLNSVFHHF